MIVSDILDLSASLNGDDAKEVYTYTKQLPHVKMATKELKEYFQQNGLPITNQTSAIITVPAGATVITKATTPPLPSDLIEIETVYESDEAQSKWIDIPVKTFLPRRLDGISQSSFGLVAWQANQLKVYASTSNRDLLLDYIRDIFSPIISENTDLDIIAGDSFLIYRTAALCAQFIGEDKSRATDLNSNASLALDRVTGIEVKATQNQPARRRPFRSRYIIRSGR